LQTKKEINMSEFLYGDNINQLSNCPPECYAEVNVLAYRWIFDNISDERNFVPRYFSRPPKYNWKNDEEKCKDLAISLFDSCNNAKSRFNFFFKTMNNKAYQFLGTKIAECFLSHKDGVADICDKDKFGHFNFHPYKNGNRLQNLKIVDEL